MRLAAGRNIARAALGLLLTGLAAVSSPARTGAQAPPDPAQRWDGLIERLSTPGQWYPESFSNPRMSRHASSADGRYFVFSAETPNDPYPPRTNLYTRDRLTGETTMSGPGPLNAPPVISSDGNHVAVELCDPVYHQNSLPVCDIWTIDRTAFTFQNMSTAPDMTPSQDHSGDAALSRTGRFVVFRTNSPTLLPPGAAPGQIVLRDRDPDGNGVFDEPVQSSIRIVSVSTAGNPGNLESAAPEVSADGRFVAFRSRASNLVPGDTNGTWDVFLHDVQTGETRRINVGWDGQEATPAIDSPAISMSEDGGFIAFAADDWYLTNPPNPLYDDNDALDVFVFDRLAGTLSRIDVGAGGTLGNGHTHWPSLSADGRYVSLVSSATNVADPGTPGREHVFVHDRATGEIVRASVNPDGSEPDAHCMYPTISGDGSLVTFVSRATNLPTAAPPETDTIYAAVHFDVTPLSLTVPARGGEVSVTVTAQQYVRWEAELTDWNWLRWGSQPAWGTGNGTATFQADRNNDPVARTTTAVAHSKVITITQEPGLGIASFSPAQGPAAGGTLVTFTGTGFEPGMRVYFDNVEATSVEFVSTTELRAVTPPHPPGDVWVAAYTGDWSAGAPANQQFHFLDDTPPVIYPWAYGNQTPDGWYTSNVEISFYAWDGQSSVVSTTGCDYVYLTTDTPGTTYTCTATSEGGTATASIFVKRDATGPAIEVLEPAPKLYRTFDPPPVAAYSCTDALTGVAECTAQVPQGALVDMTPGFHDFWVTARDGADNWSNQWFTYAVTTGVCAPGPQGLVAWFPFETISSEVPQPSYADAMSGSELVPVNMQPVQGAAGSFAIAPSAAPSYAAAAADARFEMTSAVSLAAWVKPAVTSTGIEVIAGREGDYMLGLSPDGTLLWSLATSTLPWQWMPTSSRLHRDVWAHVALTYDGSLVRVYLNGLSREGWSVTGAIVDAAPLMNEFRIGAREDPAVPSYFGGAIDEVMVANRSFTDLEIERMFLAGSGGVCGSAATTLTLAPNPVTVTYGHSDPQGIVVTLSSETGPVEGRTILLFDPAGVLVGEAPTNTVGQVLFSTTVVGSAVGTQPGFEARFPGDPYFASSSAAGVINVERAFPPIVWAPPAPIQQGTPLGPEQLNASASMPGTFTYTPPVGSQLAVGTHTLSVRFDPDDTTNYQSVTVSVPITVTDGTPPQIVAWANGQLGSNGWFTGDVQIGFDIQEPEGTITGSSGCSQLLLTADTAGTTYTCTATSAGGTNTASITVKRDATAPAASITSPIATMYESGATVIPAFTCSDAGSGTASCTDSANGNPIDTLTPGYHTFSVTATDRAGNTRTASVEYAVGSGVCAYPLPDLRGWWRFEDDTANWMISYANPATRVGLTSDVFVDGVVGHAYQFEGADGYLATNFAPIWWNDERFAMAAWVKPSANSVGTILRSNGGYALARLSNGSVGWAFRKYYVPELSYSDTGVKLPLNVWSHVAVALDNTTVRTYLNGRLAHTATNIGDVYNMGSRDGITLGGADDRPEYFKGALDEVKVFDHGLDAAQVEQLFLAGASGACVHKHTAFEIAEPIQAYYGDTTYAIDVRLVDENGLPVAGRSLELQSQVSSWPHVASYKTLVTDADGRVHWDAPLRGAAQGAYDQYVYVTFHGDVDYTRMLAAPDVVVGKGNPVITWPEPAPITYGTYLSNTQLNATANVTGTFSYSPASGTRLSAGTHTLTTNFTPSNLTNYNTATDTVSLTVTRATPAVTVSGGTLAYDGNAHAATGTVTGIGGVSLGALTFTYNGSPEPPVNAGTYEVVGTFAGTENYAPASATDTLTITPAMPTIEISSAPLFYTGQPRQATVTVRGIGGAELNPFTILYDGAATLPVNAGTYTVQVQFAGNANYAPASADGSLVINKTTPLMGLGVDNATYDGQPHGASANVLGINGEWLTPVVITYNGSATKPVNAGVYTVEARYDGAANYTAVVQTTTLTIWKAIPYLNWVTSSTITYGTPLAGGQLSATTNIPGTFSYTPPSGTLLPAGTHVVEALFTPTDTVNYATNTRTSLVYVHKAYLTVAWPAPAEIVYGTPIGAAQLNAAAGVPGTYSYSPAAGAVLDAGTQVLQVTFTPDDTANYHSPVPGSTMLRVTPAPAVLSWPSPADIVYGTALGSAQLNATASVPGAFDYSPPAGTVLGAGTHTLSVTFTPDDPNYAPATATGTMTVLKATPAITWPEPAPITYGTALGAAQLDATAPIYGEFVYSPAAGTVLGAGTHALSATFTPLGYAADNYGPAAASVTLTVNRAPSLITWIRPDPIEYGIPLSGLHLNAIANVPGTFVYNPPLGTVLEPGAEQTLSVAFTPDDVANYDGASATNLITVTRATPFINWPFIAAITYGTPLNETHLNATTTVEGTFEYAPPAGTVLNAGNHPLSVTFTPADPVHYAITTWSNGITVHRRMPVVTWGNPAPITYPAPLAATQLNAMADVPGTFTYTPAAWTVLEPGVHTLSASFMPDDTANYYTSATATTALTVTRATPVIAWPSPATIVYGTPLGAAQLNATANVTGSFTYSPSAGTVFGAGTHTLSVTFTPADTARYDGASATATLTVSPGPLAVRANDATKRFGAPLPPLGAAFAGFVNGDSPASLSGTLLLTTNATQQSAVGNYPIVPSGVSSPNYTISFAPGTLSIVRGAVNVAVATSPEPSGFDQPMTFTASVAAAAPATGSPAGTVRFYDGTTLLGSAPLTAGTATLSTAGLDAGNRTIEARYEGDGSFEPGTESSTHVIHDVTATPALALASSRNPSNAGQSVMLTATVSMPAGPVSGLVEFYSGSTVLGTSPISAGRATLTTSSLAAGSHAIVARYTGSPGVPPSRSDVFVQAVGGSGWKDRATAMTLSAAPNPAALGDTVVVVATATGSAGSAPSGRILFMLDGAVVADVPAAPAGGTAARAVLSLPGLAHGRHAITATYLGDPTYKGSTARITVTTN